jgi:EAL domain-containing protein (putative c-di-GMP-specific phosphodiesterase class I)
VDDFGTGHSSLLFITTVTVDEVKVDRSFVARLVESPEVATIVRAILEMAQKLRLRVVAEGVETVAQKDWLTESGCVAAQGYYFFRPMRPDGARGAVRALLPAAGGTVVPLRMDEAS